MQQRQLFTPEHHPFIGHINKYKAVLRKDRPAYQRMIDNTKPKQGQPAQLFLRQFPQSGKFEHQGYKLHYHSVEQTDSPAAICVFVHGINQHGGRAGYFAHLLTEVNTGLNFYALDQMNFGQSEGNYRGYMLPLKEVVEQTELFVEFVLKRFTTKPKVFLAGTSFGSVITIQMALNTPNRYKGVIFLAPAFNHNKEDAFHLKLLAKYVGIVLPRYCIPFKMTARGTKYDLQQLIWQDPHGFKDGVVPGTIRNGMIGFDQLLPQFHNFSLPYITFMGGHEKMVDVFGPIDFDEVNCSGDKTTIYCDQMWHNLFYEEEIDPIAQITATWLRRRI